MPTEDRLLARYLEAHPMDAARSLERFQPEEIRSVLVSAPSKAAAAALAALSPAVAAGCLSGMAPPTATELIEGMADDPAAGMLRRLDGAERSAVLSALPEFKFIRNDSISSPMWRERYIFGIFKCK